LQNKKIHKTVDKAKTKYYNNNTIKKKRDKALFYAAMHKAGFFARN
jgi:hypothetical protein